MTLQTKRLLLRRWEDGDAEDLYRYAKDPDVGPIAGWPPHRSVEESRRVIRDVLSGEECYAICLKEDGRAIGAIELMRHTALVRGDDECELGYWLGKPFWGRGIMPEAARALLRRAFEDLGMAKVWCGYYEGNVKSKRVQEKCGFRPQFVREGVEVPLLHETRTDHVSCLTREEWLQNRQPKKEDRMNKYIAICGLDCESCEARLATIRDDETLRGSVAKRWSELNGVEITPEMINCVGCRVDGVKTPYCEALCPIRRCALGRGFETCADCGELEGCEKAGMIIENNADALRRLRELRGQA